MYKLIPFLFVFGLMAAATRATTVTPPNFTELVTDSDYVVHGKVDSVRTEKVVRGAREVLVTFVDFRVIEVVAGQAPSADVVTLQMLGGRLGDEELWVEGSPQFVVGDEDILFVRGNGRFVSPLNGMMHGRYRVAKDPESDRKVVTRDNRQPLTNTSEVASALRPPGDSEAASLPTVEKAMSSTDFMKAIRAAAKTGSSTDE
jgi:hypothetical protein